jgi:ferrochelatase
VSPQDGAGVLLMTYGSPQTPSDVPAYLARVRGGRPPDPALAAEFTRRYTVIGGSPLVTITRAQAAALERRLGGEVPVEVGMRFSDPTIAEALARLASRGARKIAALILSPQYSPLIMGGYRRAIDESLASAEEARSLGAGSQAGGAREPLGNRAAAALAVGPAPLEVRVAEAWHLEPAFIEALAVRIRDALARFPAHERDRIPVLLTAHSLPRAVAEREPGYLAQLTGTARAVAEQAGLERRWHFCWQSAGHEPGEWMRPDLADLLPQLRADGHRAVLVAPVQFVADHLEVLYDIDVAACQQAEAAGLRFARIESLNTMPAFIDALASVAWRTLAG